MACLESPNVVKAMIYSYLSGLCVPFAIQAQIKRKLAKERNELLANPLLCFSFNPFLFTSVYAFIFAQFSSHFVSTTCVSPPPICCFSSSSTFFPPKIAWSSPKLSITVCTHRHTHSRGYQPPSLFSSTSCPSPRFVAAASPPPARSPRPASPAVLPDFQSPCARTHFEGYQACGQRQCE